MEDETETKTPEVPLENGKQASIPELPELSTRLQEVLDKISELEQFSSIIEEINGMEECDNFLKIKNLMNYLVKSDDSVREDFIGVMGCLNMNDTANCLRDIIRNEKAGMSAETEKEEILQEGQNNAQETKPQRSYKEVLEETSGTLVDCLFPTSELLHHLNKSSVLSESMVAKITVRPNRADKVKILLSFLINLGPQSLTAFVKALQATEQHFLAGVLSAFQYT